MECRIDAGRGKSLRIETFGLSLQTGWAKLQGNEVDVAPNRTNLGTKFAHGLCLPPFVDINTLWAEEKEDGSLVLAAVAFRSGCGCENDGRPKDRQPEPLKLQDEWCQLDGISRLMV